MKSQSTPGAHAQAFQALMATSVEDISTAAWAVGTRYAAECLLLQAEAAETGNYDHFMEVAGAHLEEARANAARMTLDQRLASFQMCIEAQRLVWLHDIDSNTLVDALL
jgi:hypothetical protein